MAEGSRTRRRSLSGALPVLLALWLRLGAADVTVTIYNTGDLHESAGNLARIAALVAARRARDPNVLYVDCGDTLNRGDADFTTTRGEAMFATLAACRLDAAIMGNHELSFGTARTVELMDRFSHPLLDANTLWPEGLRPQRTAPYRVFRLQGVSVALVGTASEHINHACDTQVTRRPVPDVLQELLPTVRAAADIVVLLTHVGTARDEAIAAALARAFPGPRPAVDLIIGAHDHQAYPTLRIHAPSGIAIQHSGDCGKCLGETVLTWDGTQVTDRRSRLIPLTPDLPAEPTVAQVRQSYRRRLPPEHALLWLDAPLDAAAFGRWLGSLAAAATGADVALIPPDALRAGLPAGPIGPAALLGGLKRLEPLCFVVPSSADLDTRVNALPDPAKRPLLCPARPLSADTPLRVAWFCVYADALAPAVTELGPLVAGVSNLQRRAGTSLWEVVLDAVAAAHDAGEPCPLLGSPAPPLAAALARPGDPQ